MNKAARIIFGLPESANVSNNFNERMQADDFDIDLLKSIKL